MCLRKNTHKKKRRVWGGGGSICVGVCGAKERERHRGYHKTAGGESSLMSASSKDALTVGRMLY